MKEQLTYILGAGASYQSIPLVATFPARFKEFRDFIYALAMEYAENSDIHKAKKKVHNLAEEFFTHQSFDTYFKKLYHTQNKALIKQCKKILHLYFIWEHLSPVQNAGYDILGFVKEARIDKRYDALIAGLLKPIPDKIEFYCHINFITWNYDINLISSLKNYLYPRMKFGDFMKKVKIEEHEFKISEDISILNMNGFFYSQEFDEPIDLNFATPGLVIRKKLKNDYLSDEIDDADSELIRFAWENSQPDKIANRARVMIENSKSVVIIGYTFPLYNRMMDVKYFKQFDDSQKLIIQDPNAIELREDIVSNFDLRLSKNEIISKSQCESFHVPQDIFLPPYEQPDLTFLIR